MFTLGKGNFFLLRSKWTEIALHLYLFIYLSLDFALHLPVLSLLKLSSFFCYSNKNLRINIYIFFLPECFQDNHNYWKFEQKNKRSLISSIGLLVYWLNEWLQITWLIFCCEFSICIMISCGKLKECAMKEGLGLTSYSNWHKLYNSDKKAACHGAWALSLCS